MKSISIFLLLLSSSIYAMELEQYKKLILSQTPETLWELRDLKFEDQRIWYFTDGSIKKIWSAFGACKIDDKRTCKDCTCDFYFKSPHPNNRFKGDYPYNTFSDGYPQSPNKLPSSGCMQINGLKGSCSYNNHYGLCNLSNNPKVVFKAYIKHAFENKNDPCGLREFLNTEFVEKIVKHPSLNSKAKKEKKKGN